MKPWILVLVALGAAFFLFKPSPGKKSMNIKTYRAQVPVELDTGVVSNDKPEAVDEAVSYLKISETDFRALSETISSLSEQVSAMRSENRSVRMALGEVAKKQDDFIREYELPDNSGLDAYKQLAEFHESQLDGLQSENSLLKDENGRLTESLSGAKRTIDNIMSNPPDIPTPIIAQREQPSLAVNPTDRWPKYKNTISAGYMYANGRDMWGATYARNFTGFLGLYGGVYVDQQVKNWGQVFPVGGVKVSFK